MQRVTCENFRDVGVSLELVTGTSIFPTGRLPRGGVPMAAEADGVELVAIAVGFDTEKSEAAVDRTFARRSDADDRGAHPAADHGDAEPHRPDPCRPRPGSKPLDLFGLVRNGLIRSLSEHFVDPLRRRRAELNGGSVGNDQLGAIVEFVNQILDRRHVGHGCASGQRVRAAVKP